MEKSKFEITRENLKLVGAVVVSAAAAFTVGRWIEKVSIAKNLLSAIR